jgi:hypothetical protein
MIHLVLALCALACGFAAQAQTVFPLEPYRKSVALRATINGHEGLFTFDTAGGISLLTPAFAQRAGCKPWGRITGHQMMGDRIDTPLCANLTVAVQGRRFDMPAAGVFDVMKLYPPEASPVDGLLALDIFADKAVTIDFPNRRLTLETPASLRQRVQGATEFPMRMARELQGRALAVSVGVPTPRGPVWMELDSGNGGTLLVSKPYAALFELDLAKEEPQPVDFALGGGNLRVSGRAFTPDMIIDGNIGMPFLKVVVLTLDLAAGRPAVDSQALTRYIHATSMPSAVVRIRSNTICLPTSWGGMGCTT